jgi:quinol monooxygenase YgiN
VAVETQIPLPYSADGEAEQLVHVATLQFQVTPFRAERFAQAYLPAVPTVMDRGASGYCFYRSEQEPERFTHISYWRDKGDFDQWWFGRSMQQVRRELSGIVELPAVPVWHTVLELG